jgi:hypothetical protein
MRRWIPMMLVSIVGVAGFAGCGSDDEGASAGPSLPESTLPAPSGTEVAAVYEDVDYYGACGNETLTTDEGISFYPLTSDEVEALDLDAYAVDGAPPGSGPEGFRSPLGVAPPGPGDDVGTLVVYGDGIARFESDSGNVRWLTDEFREFAFVC